MMRRIIFLTLLLHLGQPNQMLSQLSMMSDDVIKPVLNVDLRRRPRSPVIALLPGAAGTEGVLPLEPSETHPGVGGLTHTPEG
jgi:hypothetical protein